MEKTEFIVGIRKTGSAGAGVCSVIQNAAIILLAVIVVGELIINRKISWISIALSIIIFLSRINSGRSVKTEDVQAVLSDQSGYVSLLLKDCEKKAGKTVSREIRIDKDQKFSVQTGEDGQIRLNYSGENILTDSSRNVLKTRSVKQGTIDLYMDEETWEEMDHFFQNIER